MRSLNQKSSYMCSYISIYSHYIIKCFTVSNRWTGSKLLINEDILEIQDFLSMYVYLNLLKLIDRIFYVWYMLFTFIWWFRLPLSKKNEKPTQSVKFFSNWSSGSQFTIIYKFIYNVKYLYLTDFAKQNQVILTRICVFNFIVKFYLTQLLVVHMLRKLCVTIATTLKFDISK